MALLEALYGRKCQTPIYWDDVSPETPIGPELIQETKEQVLAHDRYKKYVDLRRRKLEFEEGYIRYFFEFHLREG